MKFRELIKQYIIMIENTYFMNSQLRLGGIKFVWFVIIDLLCLIISNSIASIVYFRNQRVEYIDHSLVLIVAICIDICITIMFNTLNRVLRRSNSRELLECFKHIVICCGTLCMCLFITKRGAYYSRAVIFVTYIFDFVLIFIFRSLNKVLFKQVNKNKKIATSLVMTTDAFAVEAINTLRNMNIVVKDILLLNNKGLKEIHDIPVINNYDEAATAICWKQIDKVYIYGLDDQAVPDDFIDLCREMDINVDLIDFRYRIIDVKTIMASESGYGNLAFLEGKRDIPFTIRRVYWITETEANYHRGYHAHKLNCQLLFCPNGIIDIILDDGEKKDTVRLDNPSKGIILMPGLWREMIWKESGSVLCVLASEYYDPNEYIRDYNEFLHYSKKYRKGFKEEIKH